jgi:hypothetical protein
VVPVVRAARVEVGGERHVDGDHGCECPGEDRHAHLAPEGGAAKATGGGRGGELEGGGLGERGEEALGARAEATGAVQLGQNDAELHRERRLAVNDGVRERWHLWISEAAVVRIFPFRTTTHKRTKTREFSSICAFGVCKFQIEGTINKALPNLFANIRARVLKNGKPNFTSRPKFQREPPNFESEAEMQQEFKWVRTPQLQRKPSEFKTPARTTEMTTK